MTDPLSKRRLRLWIRLLRVTRLTEAQLREFLRVEHGSTLPRFDVMSALDRADGDLTMTELSRMLLVSNGNTTTVVDRLELDGLVARLAAEQICLDVCPTSNLMLGVVPSLDVHPLPALLDAGVPCSLNADDPLLFGPNVLEEYELAREQFGFDDERLATIARASIVHSGAADDVKRSALAGIDAWLATPASVP